mmetsp:Transcript_6513/g.15256  ORF Transcript_6513/g.15256 Transcript_6513/m.15256 type:complete len:295 (+) Transcript_6513:273-1157(+)|eukprot:scaffold43634_cov64-Phaeocystis_antarctica.AAC.8
MPRAASPRTLSCDSHAIACLPPDHRALLAALLRVGVVAHLIEVLLLGALEEEALLAVLTGELYVGHRRPERHLPIRHPPVAAPWPSAPEHPVVGHDSLRAMRRGHVPTGVLVGSQAAVLHAARVRDGPCDVAARRSRLLREAELGRERLVVRLRGHVVRVHAGGRDLLRVRHHRALPQLLLARGPAQCDLFLRLHHLDRPHRGARLLDLGDLAPLGVHVDLAHHRLLHAPELLQRLQVLGARQVVVEGRLLGKPLAAGHAEWADRDDELAAVALVLLHLLRVLLGVAVPVGRAR